MRHAGWLALVTVVALASGSAVADSLKDENLLVGMPDGFVVGDQDRDGQMDMAEWIPKGETLDEWSRMVTIQIAHALGGVEPEALPESIAEGWTSACPHSAVTKILSAEENGYPMTVWSFACPLNPATGKPENMWIKTISGRDALYSVQYAYRHVLDDTLEKPALSYLAAVKVCDTRRSDRACPKGM